MPPISIKDWKDSPDTTTPISAAALEDLETRMGAYADSLTPNASTTVKGISKLSLAPVSATNPIVVGDNDLRVTADQATASIRTIGTGALQACAGNDSRLSDARTPSGIIGGHLTGSTWPTLNIATTATPQLTRLGIGAAVHASTPLVLQSAAMTDQLVSDTAHGELSYGGGLGGQRWDIRYGQVGGTGPVTTDGPTFRISTSRNDTVGVTNGADSLGKYAALVVTNRGLSTTLAQPTAGVFVSYNDGTSVYNAATANTDALGVQGRGIVQGAAATGRGLGGSFESVIGASAASTAKATGLEAVVKNEKAAHTVSGSGSDSMGVWVYSLGAFRAAAGIQFGRLGGSPGWDTGIYVGGGAAAQGNAIATNTFWDQGTSTTSIKIEGTHSDAAIAVQGSSGKVLVGVLTSTAAFKTQLLPDGDSSGALMVKAFSASQTGDIMQVRTGDNTSRFTVGSAGHITISDVNVALSTTTGTKFGTAATQKLAFWNAIPIVQPAAYTQTYATATRTVANLTSATLTDNTTGTANTTLEVISGTVYTTDVVAIRNNFADLAAQANALRVDIENVKQVLNSQIDDSQATGLCA